MGGGNFTADDVGVYLNDSADSLVVKGASLTINGLSGASLNVGIAGDFQR